MMTNYGQELLRFSVSLLYNGNAYYIERVAKLEDALADVPKQLHLEMMGDGEIDVDWALVFREVLMQRSAETQLITSARSSLKNGSVLVWLLGDRRLIRDDAKVFFRRANLTEDADIGPEKVWSECDMQYVDSYSEADPEEASHAQVLHYINEFLPVRELAGRIIDVRTLRQFGLVGNEKLDHFLATTLGPSPTCDEEAAKIEKPASDKIIVSQPAQE
ncbi:MAG: hypothetical protein EPO07_20155 [Verrucomicrobia bacterium]|nr:MAG: hypothetical protein EPO07_20155 [Verrucomicrobiota bacterium]